MTTSAMILSANPMPVCCVPMHMHAVDEVGLGDGIGKENILTAKGGGGAHNPGLSDGDKHDVNKLSLMAHVTCDGKTWPFLAVMKQQPGWAEPTLEMQRVMREGGCSGGVHMNATGICFMLMMS